MESGAHQERSVAEESFWAIEVERDGHYEISLRRWPVEPDKGINDGTYGKTFNYNKRVYVLEMLMKRKISSRAPRRSRSG